MRNFGYNAGNVFFDFMQLRAVNKAIGQVNRAITHVFVIHRIKLSIE